VAQYRLLELLYERKGKVVTREDVIRAVWPESDESGITEQAIDALMRRLRERLAEIDPEHEYITTIRGHGFRLEDRE
jgi:DNA-binding response OmpR family regulator